MKIQPVPPGDADGTAAHVHHLRDAGLRQVGSNQPPTSAVTKLKSDLNANPEIGDVIPGGGGLRKVRMAGLGRGKQGGFRVIYVLMLNRTVAVLMKGYSKSQQEDLTADQLESLAADRAVVEAAITASVRTPPQGGD